MTPIEQLQKVAADFAKLAQETKEADAVRSKLIAEDRKEIEKLNNGKILTH